MLLRHFSSAIKGKFLRAVRRDYKTRLLNEQAFYEHCDQVHDLPPIFHYWSNKFLLPIEKRFGITDPEQFFCLYTRKQYERLGNANLAIASIGSGNCEVETRIAGELLEGGCADFSIACLDINQDMLDRGRDHATKKGVAQFIRFQRGDFNHWKPTGDFDVVIANQSLHHVLELESLLKTIKKRLRPGGVFLSSDTIGRNGHVKWPEARKALNPFWDELPERYKYNQQLRRLETELIDHDCSTEGFEGIRAQDILPLLVEYFHFELFIPFANIILTFIDRAFGHNFDPSNEWDRDFIDRVHDRDQQGILSGELKPTQMLAVLRNEPVETVLVAPTLTPEFCIRLPDRE